MPMAPPRLCAGGCGRFSRGRCATCAGRRDQRRGTTTARGYDTRNWGRFRQQFFGALAQQGLAPTCGAVLPGGPQTQDSYCRRAGQMAFTSADGSSLHLDHEPPLTDEERNQPDRVCDPMRVQLLCRACHSVKTARELLPRTD